MTDRRAALDRTVGTIGGTETVLTAADAQYFAGVQTLVESIRSAWDCAIVVIDLGLRPEQVAWLDDAAVDRRPADGLDGVPDLPGESEFIWKLWIKPFFFQVVPERRVVWIDSDAIVLRNLDRLFALLDDGPVFTTTGNDHDPARNHPELYQLLRIEPREVTNGYLNAGVLAVDTARDRELIDTWTYCVSEAMARPDVAAMVRNQDQGALLWTLHRLGLLHRVTHDRAWNCLPNLPYGAPIPKLEQLGSGRKRYPRGTELLAELRRDHPRANIVHWCARPKLWELWR